MLSRKVGNIRMMVSSMSMVTWRLMPITLTHQISLHASVDAMGSNDNEQDAANNDAARSKILSAEVFD